MHRRIVLGCKGICKAYAREMPSAGVKRSKAIF